MPLSVEWPSEVVGDSYIYHPGNMISGILDHSAHAILLVFSLCGNSFHSRTPPSCKMRHWWASKPIYEILALLCTFKTLAFAVLVLFCLQNFENKRCFILNSIFAEIFDAPQPQSEHSLSHLNDISCCITLMVHIEVTGIWHDTGICETNEL